MRPRITMGRCVTTAYFALLRRVIFLGDREKSARRILPCTRRHRQRRRETALPTTMTITSAGKSSTTKNAAASWHHFPLACRRYHFHLPWTLPVRAMASFRGEVARDSYLDRDFQAYHPSFPKGTTEVTTGLPIHSGHFDHAANSQHMALTLTTATELAALFFTGALHLQLLSSMTRRILNFHSPSNQAR